MPDSIWAGVDIGGTKTAVVLSRVVPDVLNRIEFPTEPDNGPDRAIDCIKSALYEMLKAQGATKAALRGIGISCGGPLDRKAGLIQSPPNLATWNDVPIVAILAQEFDCRVNLENDANAGAVAEHRFGAGRGFHHIVFLTMGTGLGAGIILHDRLYRGANDMAGEIGHVRLTRTGPVGYNKTGSAEGWASGAGMSQIADTALKAAQRRGEKTSLTAIEGRRLDGRDVAQAALAGDRVAKRIAKICGRKLGESLAVLIDILNPECIVIGGLAMRLGDLILRPASTSLQKEALKDSLKACRIVPAALGESIGDVAALCIAMDVASHGEYPQKETQQA